MTTLRIDMREAALIKVLQGRVKFSSEALDVGDIIFESEGEPVLVIERKTVDDLKASICDQRHREQKARLLGSFPRDRVMFVIEGNMDRRLSDTVGGVLVSTLVSSMINTQLRDGVKVYKTASVYETAEFICALQAKFDKELGGLFQEQKSMSVTEYTATLKTQKKANMTPEVWFLAQLSLIPQVTEKIGAEIAKVYPSIRVLIAAYEQANEDARAGMLADITYPLKGGKIRRVGNKISTRICEFTLGVVDFPFGK
jgi:crossover junction endonuclease MUS81